MNKRFTFLLLALGLLFHACTKQTEVQPNENTPIPNFWKYTSDQSLLSTTISTLQAMGVSDSFEKYVSLFGKPLWDSSLTSLSPGEEIPSSIIIPIVHRYKQFTNAAILGAYVGDKFQYQVIYRYYMPKELIKTADDKNRWEGLFQSFDKQLFNKGPASGFKRNEEQRSGKGNANARYIEIAITYCSSYYVTNSEGVPLGPTTTTCTTQYIYQWIDDAPPYTPPTPTNPGSGSVPVTYPPSSGGGGGTTAPAPKTVVDNLTNPCLKKALTTLQSKGLKSDVNQILNKVFGVTDNIDIIFKENSTLGGDVDGRVSTATLNYIATNKSVVGSITIELNTTALAKATQEFVAATILHESLHAYMNYRNAYMTGAGHPEAVINILQHDVMAVGYVDGLKAAILEAYPSYSPSFAEAIAWGGLAQTASWSVMNEARKQDIIRKNQAEKGQVAGPGVPPAAGTKCP